MGHYRTGVRMQGTTPAAAPVLSLTWVAGPKTLHWQWLSTNPVNWILVPCGDTDVEDDGVAEYIGTARSAVYTVPGSYWLVGVSALEAIVTPFSNCVTVT